MEKHRDRFFLATKTGERGYKEARDSIRRSLERLRTDHVDLIQLHALIHPDEWERALSAGGAPPARIGGREGGGGKDIGGGRPRRGGGGGGPPHPPGLLVCPLPPAPHLGSP